MCKAVMESGMLPHIDAEEMARLDNIDGDARRESRRQGISYLSGPPPSPAPPGFVKLTLAAPAAQPPIG